MFYPGIFAVNSLPIESWDDLQLTTLNNGVGNATFIVNNNFLLAADSGAITLTGNDVVVDIRLEMIAGAGSVTLYAPPVDFVIFTGSTVKRDVQSLDSGTILEFYELDTSIIGGSIYRFHAGTNELYAPVVWQGNTYSPMPIEASGFEVTGSGSLPRPNLKVANITGVLGALVKSLDDLVGAKITRKRTMKRYIDGVNFAGGVNPTADPNQYFPDEVYFVNRKVNENKMFIEFELASAMDVQGIKLPRRQVIQNTCAWVYRSAECGYAGGAVANIRDEPTSNINDDACGKRLNSCKLRFGQYSELSYGGYPGAGLLS